MQQGEAERDYNTTHRFKAQHAVVALSHGPHQISTLREEFVVGQYMRTRPHHHIPARALATSTSVYTT